MDEGYPGFADRTEGQMLKGFVKALLPCLIVGALWAPAFAHEQEEPHLTGRVARLYRQGTKTEAWPGRSGRGRRPSCAGAARSGVG